ncbi:MAG TPA: hypothetical protein VGM92_01990 [Candidatus Kapabacteria bacterium]|jgi:hypothetical protein
MRQPSNFLILSIAVFLVTVGTIAVGCNDGNQLPTVPRVKQDTVSILQDSAILILKAPPFLVLIPASPNPAHDSTVIGFKTDRKIAFSLDLFNAVGKNVLGIASNEIADSGTHLFTIRMGTLSVGVFIYRLSTSFGTLSGEFVVQ